MFPSSVETGVFGSTSEAMAMGKSVLHSDTPCLCDLNPIGEELSSRIQEGRCLFLVVSEGLAILNFQHHAQGLSVNKHELIHLNDT